MAEYKYTSASGKIPDLLKKIKQTGIPSKVSSDWLKTVGYKSSNDRSLIGVLKFVDFVDSSGTPTEVWKNFRGADGKDILGNALKSSYSELFSMYPDACERKDTELEDFFRTKTTGGAEVVRQIVSTFKSFCGEANLGNTNQIPPVHEDEHEEEEEEVVEQKTAKTKTKTSASPSLHIDIQVHISPESSPEQIEKIFESMGKHIYKP